MRRLTLLLLSVAVLLGTLTTYAATPGRTTYNLNDNWRFYYADAADGANADYITLPHTWNSTGKEGEYMRTMANYLRDVDIPASWQGQRIFLRFGGAQTTAELYVNGRYVGEHHGGFTAFIFEITDFVRYGERNYLRVVVSNNECNDVFPLSTDINLWGGIYRDVELMTTPQNVISPLYYATEGVLVEQCKVSADRVEGVVKVYLSTPSLDHTTVTMRIVDEDGYEVTRRTVKASKISPERAVELPFEVVNPSLWTLTRRTMYDVEVTLGEEKKPLDRVVVKTGFRSIEVNDDNRFCLNGLPLDVRGVNMPHDRAEVGMAVSHEHLCDDLATVRDMGANAIRSLVGPHDDYLYTLCDQEGVLVWIDMPLTRAELSLTDIVYTPSMALRNNGFEQLREIVAQNYNHPSVSMWGLFSLVWQRGDDVISYIGELNDLAHKLDASRPTVSCSNADGAINFVTDLVVLRQNVGWIKGSVEDVDIWCGQLSLNKAWSALRYGVNYGEAGVRGHYVEHIGRATHATRHFPERRQSDMHERYIEQIEQEGIFWGVWLDNMFDYASSRRTCGMNFAGMVDYAHSNPKDAYFLYRARWNKSQPTLHIADRGWSERKSTQQTIDVYSSVGEPVLEIEGETIAMMRVGECHYRAEGVELRGEVTICAYDSKREHYDSITIRCGGYDL